jgi:prepilin-type N-terminal cleavage/methylation domain-containing protein
MKKGFTLLETIIAIVILGLFFSSQIVLTSSLIKANSNINVKKNILNKVDNELAIFTNSPLEYSPRELFFDSTFEYEVPTSKNYFITNKEGVNPYTLSILIYKNDELYKLNSIDIVRSIRV